MRSILFFGIPTLLIPLSGLAQSVSVTDEDGHPLPYSKISVTSSQDEEKVFYTDRSGKASPDFGETRPLILSIESLGYCPETDTVYGSESLRYALSVCNEQLNDIVVTAQYHKTPTEAAVHEVRVINREKIENLGANNVSEVLARELNIRVSQDQVLGSGLELQGVSGRNVKILIDGVPVIGRLDGNIDLSQIMTNNIERIEMINGPLSVQYGTDALGGTINIITRKPSGDRTLQTEVNTYYESVGQYNTHVTAGWSSLKHRISATAGRQYFDGWNAGDRPFEYMSDIHSDSSRFQSWKPKLQWMGRLNYDYRSDSALSVNSYVTLFDEEIKNRGIPRGAYSEYAFDDTYRTQRYDLGTQIDIALSPDQNIHIIAANNLYRREKNTYYRDLRTLSAEFTEDPDDQDTTWFNTLMSRGNWNSTAGNRTLTYALGYDVSYESTFGQRIENREQELTNLAVFTDAEWTPYSNLTVRPGLRIGYNSLYSVPLIPSVHIRWGRTEDVFRISYARGFRSPTLKELYFRFVDVNHNIAGNLSLSPENGHNIRVGYTRMRPYSGGRINWTLTGYYNHITDMISLAQTENSDTYTYVNIGRFRSLGFNLRNAWTFTNLSIDAGVGYVGRWNDQLEVLNKNMLFSPEGQLSATYSVSVLNFSLFYKYNGTRYGYTLDANDEIIQTRIEDYHTLDFTVSSSFFNKTLRCTIGARNLANTTSLNAVLASGTHSSEGNSIPQSRGRSYFVGITYNFNR